MFGLCFNIDPVSYTHLDVYKRQGFCNVIASHQCFSNQNGIGAVTAYCFHIPVSYTHLDVYKRPVNYCIYMWPIKRVFKSLPTELKLKKQTINLQFPKSLTIPLKEILYLSLIHI